MINKSYIWYILGITAYILFFVMFCCITNDNLSEQELVQRQQYHQELIEKRQRRHEKLMEYYEKRGYKVQSDDKFITPTPLLPLTNPINPMHNTFFNYGLK